MDEVDATLAKQPFLTGQSLSYVDATSAALAASLVLEHVLMSEPSLDANGRFVSFARRVDEPVSPPEILAMQERLMGRACGRFVRGLFLQWRGAGGLMFWG